jgi:uncharacterized protein YkwD
VDPENDEGISELKTAVTAGFSDRDAIEALIADERVSQTNRAELREIFDNITETIERDRLATAQPELPTVPGITDTIERAVQDAANWDIARLDTARDVDYLSPIEKDVILEMNKVRTDPRRYAELYLQPRLSFFLGRNYSVPGETPIETQEGITAVNDCITALNNALSIGLLHPERGLSLAARDHVADQGRTGQTGHNGSDWSTPESRMRRHGSFRAGWILGENNNYGSITGREIVIALLIDDGIPDRVNRGNILNGSFTQTGAGFGTHPQHGTMCTITFANAYVSN